MVDFLLKEILYNKGELKVVLEKNSILLFILIYFYNFSDDLFIYGGKIVFLCL